MEKHNICAAAAIASAWMSIWLPVPASAQPNQQPVVLAQAQPSAYGEGIGQAMNQAADQATAARSSQYRLTPKSTNGAPFKWPAPTPSDLVVTTAPTVEGFRIVAYRGLVEGVSVKEPSGVQDFAASMQSMFSGGQIDAFGQMCEEGRVQAYNTLMNRAKGMGANAVIGVHFDSEQMTIDKEHTATAVVCYGTAVVIEPISR